MPEISENVGLSESVGIRHIRNGKVIDKRNIENGIENICKNTFIEGEIKII